MVSRGYPLPHNNHCCASQVSDKDKPKKAAEDYEVQPVTGSHEERDDVLAGERENVTSSYCAVQHPGVQCCTDVSVSKDEGTTVCYSACCPVAYLFMRDPWLHTSQKVNPCQECCWVTWRHMLSPPPPPPPPFLAFSRSV